MHVVALSGGHDSSAVALELKEREPRAYTYICTPTGDESPEMFAHWRNLGERLGSRILPIMAGTLDSLIRQEGMIPNFRALLQHQPMREWPESAHDPMSFNIAEQISAIGNSVCPPVARALVAANQPHLIETRQAA